MPSESFSSVGGGRGLTQTSFKRFIGREEPRRAAASARVGKKGLSTRNRVYIGLLRGGVFLGDFPGENWSDFSPLSSAQLDLCSEIGWFSA